MLFRSGKRAVTRRWDPASNEFKFTAIGKKYYSTLRRNYVVDVPIIIKGKRKNGTRYEIKSHTKMEKLGMRPVEVPLNLTLDQRREYIKRARQQWPKISLFTKSATRNGRTTPMGLGQSTRRPLEWTPIAESQRPM